MGLFIFSFNTVTNATLKYFNCVPVEGDRVVASVRVVGPRCWLLAHALAAHSPPAPCDQAPAVSCNSTEYKNLLALAVVLLLLIVLGVPIGMFLVLFLNNKKGLLPNPKFVSRFGECGGGLCSVRRARRLWFVVLPGVFRCPPCTAMQAFCTRTTRSSATGGSSTPSCAASSSSGSPYRSTGTARHATPP